MDSLKWDDQRMFLLWLYSPYNCGCDHFSGTKLQFLNASLRLHSHTSAILYRQLFAATSINKSQSSCIKAAVTVGLQTRASTVKVLCSLSTVRARSGVHPAYSSVDIGNLLHGVNRSEREAGHTLTKGQSQEWVEQYLHSPHMCSGCAQTHLDPSPFYPHVTLCQSSCSVLLLSLAQCHFTASGTQNEPSSCGVLRRWHFSFPHFM